MRLFVIYLLAVNLVGLILMLADKRRAVRRQWRIPEKTLFLTAILGGSLGSILGMWLFHHKTKHWRFVLGLPVILALQVFLWVLLRTDRAA